jgi:hypothetical protein
VLTLYLLGALSGATALLISYLAGGPALILAAVIIAAMLLAVALLEKAPYERQAAKP